MARFAFQALLSGVFFLLIWPILRLVIRGTLRTVLPGLVAFLDRVQIALFARVFLIVFAMLNIVLAGFGRTAMANPGLFPVFAISSGVFLTALIKLLFRHATIADPFRALWQAGKRLYEMLEAWANRSVHR